MSKEIRALRERYGLSREQFCVGFEIPYRTLQSWEVGARCCPVYVFRMIEKILELSERSGGLEAFKNSETK